MLDDVVSFGAALDKRNLAKIAQRASETLDGGRIQRAEIDHATDVAPEIRKLATEIQTKIVPFIDSAEAETLRAAVERALTGEEAAADELTAASRKYSYLL